MSTDHARDHSDNPPRGPAAGESARIGALVVIGNGASLEACARRGSSPWTSADAGHRPAPAARATDAPARRSPLSDGTVSGLHARIQRAERRPICSSSRTSAAPTAPTSTARRIAGPVPLRDGAVLFLGSQVLVFRLFTRGRAGGGGARTRPRRSRRCHLLAAAGGDLPPSCGAWPSPDAEILLVGETGVGKEVFASAVHRLSGRTGKLIAINCAAIPRELVESELFGYEKGAHSTAQGRKIGLVEAGRRRHAVPRRDRRDAAGAAGQAAALPAGPAVHAARIDARRGGGRPHHRGHQPGRARQGARTCRRRCWGAWGRSPSCCRRCASGSRTSAGWRRYFLRDIGDGRAFEPEAFQALLLHDWPLNVRELSRW